MIYKSSNCLTQTYFLNSIYVIGEQNICYYRAILFPSLTELIIFFFILHNVYSSIHLLHCKIVKSRKYATLFFVPSRTKAHE